MASACVNNVSIPTDAFPSFGWLSPRISFSRDLADPNPDPKPEPQPDLDSSGKDFIDFEFHLHDPVAMLPADELFSDGKLMPLHLAPLRAVAEPPAGDEIRMPEMTLKPRIRDEVIGSETFAVSPKAPTCSSRWRELLRLKKQQINNAPRSDVQINPPSKNAKSLKYFLNRNARSCADSTLSLPLLKDSESDPPLSISSRLSLSSTSSSGPDAEDVPRLSLDSDKPNPNPFPLNRNPPKVRVSRARYSAAEGRVAARAGRSPVRRAPDAATAPPPRCASVDSPRMNASGKVVFQGLGRSSSSPSTFNGGPRIKHRGMERSYSANVRVTPVLNVPVCTLRGSSSKSGSVFGFGQLFSAPKKDREGGVISKSSSNNKGRN